VVAGADLESLAHFRHTLNMIRHPYERQPTAVGRPRPPGGEMIVQIEIDEYPQIRHAIQALDIERNRLLKAIEELRSAPAAGEDDPTARVNEQIVGLDETETAIALLRDCVEAARHTRQREYPLPKEPSKKRRAKRSSGPKRKDGGNGAADDESKPA
jgi:hypothetical protein